MNNSILWLVSSIGITHILTGSSLVAPLRKFAIKSEIIPEYIKNHIQCNQCAGFWVGIFSWLSIKIIQKYEWIEIKDLLLAIIIYGPVCSILSDLVYRLKQFLCKECG
jgi:hypothetical protein